MCIRDRIKADDKFVCLFEEELDNIAVRNFVNDACERCQGICAAFVGTDEDGYRYIIGSSSTDVREFAKKLNEDVYKRQELQVLDLVRMVRTTSV